ncbi:bifunctional phosphatase IMPL2, chloroplastic-like [Macadamia integrifolia]|uniref:bifunctional phosphatase IMPL2, chloroplastic-like n=1 Tax=Macadamia integrifolia TaxID=60698 RepID=UPI001C4EFE5E|nr:bifunctional phosphatase IMPL2, chloroplastic-like [Macadamia integrifolia]
MPILSHSKTLAQSPTFLPLPLISPNSISRNRSIRFLDHPSASALKCTSPKRRISAFSIMNSSSNLSNGIEIIPLGLEEELDRFIGVAYKLADAAGVVIRTYFRESFVILDKVDLSPVTIADRAAEESMVSIILENFPSHAIYGEENGWLGKDKSADYVWVLDPIDGTKSFITGKPLFGTLIALLHKGKPILGIIDQPVLRERWLGVRGRRTTFNGEEISTRTCAKLSQAYLYTTSPLMFSGDAEEAIARVRSKVKVPLYGCDCYAYALLASGFVDLVIESGIKPYDFLSLIPVIEGAGGAITNWSGHPLNWETSSDSQVTTMIMICSTHSLSLSLLGVGGWNFLTY